MAGPIHGSIEHYFVGSATIVGSGSLNVFFVNVYNFLNNNTGTLGIRRIAYHTGSTSAGAPAIRGMNFYDAALPAGDNAWACFAFTSASVPFYVLIQYSSSAAVGASPGSPGLFKANGAQANAFACAFAARADGGSPWNGSSGSTGQETKGSSVWTPGTSSLFVAPRSNDVIRGGSHGALKQNMMGFTMNPSTDFRQSLLADYDNFCILYDISVDNTYSVIMYGAYTPLSGLHVDIPQFCFDPGGTVLPLAVGTAFGDLVGSNTAQGGMSYPTIASGGNCVTSFDRYGTIFFQNVNASPNQAFLTTRYDEYPFLVGINETPNLIGATGQSFQFYREVYNMATHDTNVDGSRAVFGNITIPNVKLTVPWYTGTIPGSGVSRAGVQF